LSVLLLPEQIRDQKSADEKKQVNRHIAKGLLMMAPNEQRIALLAGGEWKAVVQNHEHRQYQPDGIEIVVLPALHQALNGIFQSRQIAGSNRLGNQIVIRVADDFDFGKFSNRQFAANVNASVNVRGIGFTSSNQVVDS